MSDKKWPVVLDPSEIRENEVKLTLLPPPPKEYWSGTSFRATYTRAELEDPNNRFHEDWLKWKAKNE